MTRLKKIVGILALLIICNLAAVIATIRAIGALISGNEDRAWMIAQAFDRLGNAAGNGDPREMISERAARGQREGARWACVLCKLLHRLDPGHCERYDKGNTDG